MITFPEISAKTFCGLEFHNSELPTLGVRVHDGYTECQDRWDIHKAGDRKTQRGLVYGRLTRLRALEVLALGHYIRMVDERQSIMCTAHSQKDCLTMTLDSGLGKAHVASKPEHIECVMDVP